MTTPVRGGALGATSGSTVYDSTIKGAGTVEDPTGVDVDYLLDTYLPNLGSISNLVAVADEMLYSTAEDTWALTTVTAAARALLDDANAAAMRSTLGLVIGTDVQAQDAELAAIAGLTSAADKVPYFTGSGTAAVADFTAAGRALVDDASASAQRTTLGVGTGDSPQFTAVELGHATDTTIARVSAGRVSIEGNPIVLEQQAINAQTGTTYTLAAGDCGKLVTLSNGSAITLTVPQDSDATIPVGTYIDVMQLGAGQVTVAAGTGATLRISGATAKARAQFSRLAVQKISANTWSLMGDLAAS